MIESYSFGYIVIDGKSYTSDVVIYADRVDDSWWRKRGHLLTLEDLKGVIAEGTKTLIIGTGRSGLMRVPPETLQYLTSRGFEVIVENTGDACQSYNRLSQQGPVIAALHLSC
jgi:hypothetical protein